MIAALIAILSIWLHELGHAVASHIWGDSYGARRLTWKPLVNLDPLFSVVLPVLTGLLSGSAFALGTGRPFLVAKYRWQIVAAGPMVNLGLGLALWPIWRQAAVVNLLLGGMNLLPLRPLDGWVLWNVWVKK